MTDSETVGKCPCGSCAFKLRHYTAFRRLPLLCALAWAEAVGCESSSSDMSGALSSCCGEYRSVPADSRTVVPIGAANSVHTLLLTAKIGQKLYVFVQLLMKYFRIKIKNSCLHRLLCAILLHMHMKWRWLFELFFLFNKKLSRQGATAVTLPKCDYPFSTPAENAVNKRIIDRRISFPPPAAGKRYPPTTLSSARSLFSVVCQRDKHIPKCGHFYIALPKSAYITQEMTAEYFSPMLTTANH